MRKEHWELCPLSNRTCAGPAVIEVLRDGQEDGNGGKEQENHGLQGSPAGKQETITTESLSERPWGRQLHHDLSLGPLALHSRYDVPLWQQGLLL